MGTKKLDVRMGIALAVIGLFVGLYALFTNQYDYIWLTAILILSGIVSGLASSETK